MGWVALMGCGGSESVSSYVSVYSIDPRGRTSLAQLARLGSSTASVSWSLHTRHPRLWMTSWTPYEHRA
eukprot:2223285-Pyramimonas_sp.AAC.1